MYRLAASDLHFDNKGDMCIMDLERGPTNTGGNMMSKMILPLTITKYEASIADEIANFKGRLQEEDLIDRYKDDLRLENHLESQRVRADIVSDSEYFNILNKIFKNDLSDDVAVSNFLCSGGIVLKPEEVKNLNKVGARNLNI